MKRNFRAVLRDLFLYVAVALLVVAIAFALGALTAKMNEPPDILLNWVGLGGVMTIVYATAIYKYRAMWKSSRFWSGITLAMLFEIGLGIVALWSVPRISTLFWGMLVYPANVVTVNEFLTRWLGAAGRTS